MLCTNVSTSGETYAPAVGKKFGLVKPNCLRTNARTVLFKSLYSNCKLKGGRLPRPRYITLCLRPTSNACSNTFAVQHLHFLFFLSLLYKPFPRSVAPKPYKLGGFLAYFLEFLLDMCSLSIHHRCLILNKQGSFKDMRKG